MGKKVDKVSPIMRIDTNKIGTSPCVFYGRDGTWSFDVDPEDLADYMDELNKQLSYAELYERRQEEKRGLL